MSQNFKKIYDINKFVNIIKEYCINEKNTEYIFSPISYKKMQFNKVFTTFINDLIPYYHKSKQFYLKRNMTYKNTLTIFRQLLNSLCIPYTSKIIYNKSKYSIHYIIILNNELANHS
jgi:hypothetical protein